MSSAMFSGLMLLLCTVLVVQGIAIPNQLPASKQQTFDQQLFQNGNLNDYPHMNFVQISGTDQQNQVPDLFGSTYYSKKNQINIGSVNTETLKTENVNPNFDPFVPPQIKHQDMSKEIFPQYDTVPKYPLSIEPLFSYPSHDQEISGISQDNGNNDQVKHQIPASQNNSSNSYQATSVPQKNNSKPVIVQSAPEHNLKKDVNNPVLIGSEKVIFVTVKSQPVTTATPPVSKLKIIKDWVKSVLP